MADFHRSQLQGFCRVCGKLLSRNRVSFSQSDKLAKVFGILLCHDSPDIHPPFMCHGCYNVLMRSKNAEKSGTQYQSSVQVFTWEAHLPAECSVCDHIGSTRTGGRPKKQRKPGRPPTISTRTVIDHVHSLAPPSFIP